MSESKHCVSPNLLLCRDHLTMQPFKKLVKLGMVIKGWHKCLPKPSLVWRVFVAVTTDKINVIVSAFSVTFSHWSSLSLALTSFCYSISAQLLASLLCRISAPILPNAHAQFPSPSVPALSAHARLATLCDKLATNVLGEAGRGLTVNRAPFCRLYRLLSPSHG